MNEPKDEPIGERSRHDRGSSSLHTWLNSIGVVLAMVGTIANAIFTYQGNHAKDDNITLYVLPESTCTMSASIRDHGQHVVVTACWAVRVDNLSAGPVSITSFDVTDQNGGLLPEQHWAMKTLDDQPLTLPLYMTENASQVVLATLDIPAVPATESVWKQAIHPKEAIDRGDGSENTITFTLKSLTDIWWMDHAGGHNRLKQVVPDGNLCRELGDIDQNDQCRVHYVISAKTSHGAPGKALTALPK